MTGSFRIFMCVLGKTLKDYGRDRMGRGRILMIEFEKDVRALASHHMKKPGSSGPGFSRLALVLATKAVSYSAATGTASFSPGF